MTDQKLNFNMNLGEIWYIISDIIDYMTYKFKTTDPIDWIKLIVN